MQLKGSNIKFKKEDVERIRRTLPVIVARHFMTIVLSGGILALLLGVYYFYQNVYVLTEEDYTSFVSVREVNARIFQDVLEFVEDRQTGTVSDSIPDPF